MSIFFPESRATSGTLGPPRDPVVAAWFGQGSQSSSGMNVTPDNAMVVTAVYRAVSLTAQTYASLPVGVFKYMPNGGTVLDIDHPLHYILTKKPNRWQTSFEWREMMYGHFAMRARCYSEIISTGGKAVSELVPLHPDHVRPFKAPNGKLAFEYSQPDGTTRIILQDEMCYMHGLAIGEDGVTPLSPIAAAGREAIGNAIAIQEHSGKLFANGTRLGGLLKMPGHLKDDTSRKGLLDGWNRAFGGTRNTGKTALLEDGMEWQALGMTSEDAQMLETMQFSIADVSRIFGIPPHLLSDLTRATFGNIEEQGIEFVTHTVRPGAVRREEALERDLLYGRSAITHCIKFDLDALMRGNAASRAAYYASALQNGYLSRNEVRIEEGNNPSDDEGMNKYTVQVNMTTVDKVGVLPPPPAAPTEAPGAEAARSLAREIAEIESRAAVRSAELRVEAVRAQPAPVAPVYHIAPPSFTLNQGEVRVDVAAPEIRNEITTPEPVVNVAFEATMPEVAAPAVNVRVDNHVPEQRAAEVTVNVPAQVDMRIIEMPKRRTISEIERDGKGDIVSTTQVERDV